MDPSLTHNILWSAATLLYSKVIVMACDGWLQPRLGVPADISRKIVHLSACHWVLFWPQFDPSHWSWKLNVAIPAVYAVQLTLKGAIQKDPTDPNVRTLSRTGNPSELLYGPLLFTLVMIFCGWHEFMRPCGIYIMGALVGDGLAPLVGTRYPVWPYRSMGGTHKTVAGSLTMFVGSFVGIATYAHLVTVPARWDLETVAMVSLVATLAEAVSGIWDNPAIAVSVYAFVRATTLSTERR